MCFLVSLLYLRIVNCTPHTARHSITLHSRICRWRSRRGDCAKDRPLPVSSRLSFILKTNWRGLWQRQSKPQQSRLLSGYSWFFVVWSLLRPIPLITYYSDRENTVYLKHSTIFNCILISRETTLAALMFYWKKCVRQTVLYCRDISAAANSLILAVATLKWRTFRLCSVGVPAHRLQHFKQLKRNIIKIFPVWKVAT